METAETLVISRFKPQIIENKEPEHFAPAPNGVQGVASLNLAVPTNLFWSINTLGYK
jgi:hypothetical protein